ncbi:MAG: hypothetical protein KC897_12095 [Candidatus Omnitrophica bacterium]|nr:hypothetical protein [Candidatus Omnitrophota bacterium]MCB9720121.1 hypothetical protein [Candidatus Omnitrophota bacterium]
MNKKIFLWFTNVFIVFMIVSLMRSPGASAEESARERLRRARQADRGPYVATPATGKNQETVPPPVDTGLGGKDPREDLFRFLIRYEWCGSDVRYVFQPDGKALLVYDTPEGSYGNRDALEKRWNIPESADAVVFDDGSRIDIARRERRSFWVKMSADLGIAQYIDCGPGVWPHRYSVKDLPPLPRRKMKK